MFTWSRGIMTQWCFASAQVTVACGRLRPEPAWRHTCEYELPGKQSIKIAQTFKKLQRNACVCCLCAVCVLSVCCRCAVGVLSVCCLLSAVCCVLCAVRCALCAVRSALCALRSALCALRSALCAVRSALCALRSVLCALRSALCAVRCALCSVRCALCAARCAVCVCVCAQPCSSRLFSNFTVFEKPWQGDCLPHRSDSPTKRLLWRYWYIRDAHWLPCDETVASIFHVLPPWIWTHGKVAKPETAQVANDNIRPSRGNYPSIRESCQSNHRRQAVFQVSPLVLAISASFHINNRVVSLPPLRSYRECHDEHRPLP